MLDIELFNKRMQVLHEAQQNLQRIEAQFADQPELLEFYGASAKALVRAAKESLCEALGVIPMVEDVDVWFTLRGRDIGKGRAPAGVISSFLSNLTIANQHAVSILEREEHSGRRFLRKIRDIAEPDVVTTMAGSLKIGIRRPSIDRLLSSALPKIKDQEPIFFKEIEKSAFEAFELLNRSLEGIQLLIKAIRVTIEDEPFDELEKQIGGRQNLLRLLYHAQSLIPSPKGPLDSIEVSGSCLDDIKVLQLARENRYKYEARVEQLLDEHQYIEGTGLIRQLAVDYDQLRGSVQARPFFYDNNVIESLDCHIDENVADPHLISSLGERLVRLSGFLVLDYKGNIHHLEVDAIEILYPNDTEA